VAKPLEFFLESHGQYGDVVRFKFGPFRYYLVNDPNVVKHVLVDNPKAYTKSRNYMGLKVVLGEGLLTSEGDFWRRQRKLAQPRFIVIGSLGSRAKWPAPHATCSRAGRAKERRRRSASTTEMMRLTFRIVGLTLFSADVDGEAREVGEALNIAMHWANDHAESMIRIPPSIPTPSNLRFRRAKRRSMTSSSVSSESGAFKPRRPASSATTSSAC